MEYLALSIDCGTIRVSIPSGSILFSSTPPGADIYLTVSGGGLPINTTLQTPNTISDLPVENYDYILKLTGFQDHTGTVSVNANETTPVIVDFIPLRAPAPATASAIVVVSGVSLLGFLLITSE